MMSWMAERDRLLAQTRAFVKEVAAARPKSVRDTSLDPLPIGSPRGDAGVMALPVAGAASPVSKTPEPAPSPPSIALARPVLQNTPRKETIVAEANVPAGWASIGGGGESDRAPERGLDRSLDLTRSESKAQPSDAVLIIPRIASSERDDIAIRVAHFREHQRRLNREREAYSEQLRARIRSVIGSGGSAA